MVLERLISMKTALRQPQWMLILGGLVSVICLFISFVVFQTSTGLMTSLLVTIAVTPLMLRLVRYDEKKEELEAKFAAEGNILARHRDILTIYSAFFSGMIITLSIVFILLPSVTGEKIFSDQLKEINLIRGNVAFGDTLQRIIFNNIGVLFLSFVFSFLFGAGAIFILAWNASILAAAIGMAAKSLGGVTGLPFAVLAFFPHGSLEILAYFIGGVAGGLISAAITRKKSPRFNFIVKDTAQLMLISVLVLSLAALVESIEIALSA
ncbi:MAG: stage II sporulation protein M [Candidatus Aenigmatarchaeota archaeon]